MPGKKIGFDAVREIGLKLPDVVDGTAKRGFALKLNGRLLACEPSNRAAEPDSLMVRLSFEERERLLSDSPDVYYLPDHYVKHPCVLVRLDRISRKRLGELLKNAWRYGMELG